MTNTHELPGRWRALWQTVTDGDAEAIYQEVAARYAEPHRAYHTLEHIGECLFHLDLARHLLSRPVVVELAVWFHDAVYDPRRTDNEEQSALLARHVLLTEGVEAVLLERVAEMIRLTSHERDDLEGDEGLLCDVDLAILGAKPERFDLYDADIRREYGWVPETVYKRERERVLARFLGRAHIYHSSYFRNKLEKQARENIARAIQRFRV